MRWQSLYSSLVKKVSNPATWGKTIELLKDRSTKINAESRITGNALIHIVDEILRYRRRGLSDAEVQHAIEDLIGTQTLDPDFSPASPRGEPRDGKTQPIVRSFLSVVHGYREDI